ncbi:hypothetical protein, partial [Pseudomonas viridiflava]|uniref:hypothetical protein n=1 Tax=Pseudomonas viridiflava TaxID=33069 RepID=UPI00197E0D57
SHSGADTPVLATAFAPPASFNFTMNQFDARQRYVEDVVAPPTKNVFIQQITCCLIRGGFRKQNFLTRCNVCNQVPMIS